MPLQPPPTPPDDAADQLAADAQYYRRVLHELIDMGADLARRVHSQAKAVAPVAGPEQDATVAFDRIARAVRRTIALARTLDEPVPPRAGQDGAPQRIAARKLIIRQVEDAIRREAGESEREGLHDELLDRLDAPDLDHDIRTRPIEKIIDEIETDLGISGLPGLLWKRRTPADLATLYARAAASGAAARAVSSPAGGGPPASAAEDGGTLLLCPTRFRGK